MTFLEISIILSTQSHLREFMLGVLGSRPSAYPFWCLQRACAVDLLIKPSAGRLQGQITSCNKIFYLHIRLIPGTTVLTEVGSAYMEHSSLRVLNGLVWYLRQSTSVLELPGLQDLVPASRSTSHLYYSGYVSRCSRT